jgi:hypothetical protein
MGVDFQVRLFFRISSKQQIIWLMLFASLEGRSAARQHAADRRLSQKTFAACGGEKKIINECPFF